jgi:flagella basal body P-ring formation protein FlgA
MNKLIQTVRAGLALLLLLEGVLLAAAEPVSLRRILAPVALAEPAAETPPARTPAPESQSGTPAPEIQRLGLSDIVARLQEHVERNHAFEGSLQLKSTARWDALRIPSGADWDLLLTNDFAPDMSGRWFAAFDVLVDGEVLASRHLRTEASLFQEVWMAQQRLERGTRPLEPAIRVVTRDIFRERGSPVPAHESLDGFELLRTLPEGRLLTWDDLKERPAVRRGDFVEIRVEQGALTITVRGRCLEDGLIGETVAVKNASSHRELMARVVGRDRVEFIP